MCELISTVGAAASSLGDGDLGERLWLAELDPPNRNSSRYSRELCILYRDCLLFFLHNSP